MYVSIVITDKTNSGWVVCTYLPPLGLNFSWFLNFWGLFFFRSQLETYYLDIIIWRKISHSVSSVFTSQAEPASTWTKTSQSGRSTHSVTPPAPKLNKVNFVLNSVLALSFHLLNQFSSWKASHILYGREISHSKYSKNAFSKEMKQRPIQSPIFRKM